MYLWGTSGAFIYSFTRLGHIDPIHTLDPVDALLGSNCSEIVQSFEVQALYRRLSFSISLSLSLSHTHTHTHTIQSFEVRRGTVTHNVGFEQVNLVPLSYDYIDANSKLVRSLFAGLSQYFPSFFFFSLFYFFHLLQFSNFTLFYTLLFRSGNITYLEMAE